MFVWGCRARRKIILNIFLILNLTIGLSWFTYNLYICPFKITAYSNYTWVSNFLEDKKSKQVQTILKQAVLITKEVFRLFLFSFLFFNNLFHTHFDMMKVRLLWTEEIFWKKSMWVDGAAMTCNFGQSWGSWNITWTNHFYQKFLFNRLD